MIYTVLLKVLDNLNADTPDLSYIKGMVEVLLAMQENPNHVIPVGQIVPATVSSTYAGPITATVMPEIKQDEGTMLDNIAAAQLGKVKELAAKSSD